MNHLYFAVVNIVLKNLQFLLEKSTFDANVNMLYL